MCVGNLTMFGSDNGLSPGRRQAIIWTNAGTLLIGPLGKKRQWNFYRNSSILFQETVFESVVCELVAILTRHQCVNQYDENRLALHPFAGNRAWLIVVIVEWKPRLSWLSVLLVQPNIYQQQQKYAHDMVNLKHN